MKYQGTIVGFKSSVGSIYHIITEDSKCYAWKANVEAEFDKKMWTIKFSWNGESFELSMRLEKEDQFKGKIFLQEEKFGNIYLLQYKKESDIILTGDFDEDEAGNYNCFIELKPKDSIII